MKQDQLAQQGLERATSRKGKGSFRRGLFFLFSFLMFSLLLSFLFSFFEIVKYN